ncbi:MAG TPA: hypothetical protein VGI70_20760 [Polyangiales bacterium]
MVGALLARANAGFAQTPDGASAPATSAPAAETAQPATPPLTPDHSPPNQPPPSAAASPSPPPSAAGESEAHETRHELLQTPHAPMTIDEHERALEAETRRYLGFSLRLTAGLGYANARRDVDAGTDKLRGVNAVLSLDVGASAIENLIIFGRVSGLAFNHASSHDTPNAGSAYFGLIGAGARYHFMPIDWYVSGVLALALVRVTRDLGMAENAHPGFGIELETGKNWWAGTKLQKRTIGLGLRFSYVTAGSIGEGDHAWNGSAFSLVFSTSYN